jgi:hypothetical protein
MHGPSPKIRLFGQYLHHTATYTGCREGKKNSISPTGNRTPASCELFRGMTSRNTDHYTIEDIR